MHENSLRNLKKWQRPRSPNRADRLPKPWGKTPRVGRVMRQVKRLLIVTEGRAVSGSAIVQYAYPRLRQFKNQHYAQAALAAARFYKRVGWVSGRKGRTILWAPKPELEHLFR